MAIKTAKAPVPSKNKLRAGKAQAKKTPKARKAVTNKRQQKKEGQEDLDRTYNEFKEFEGRQYTGMKIGRSHRWNYDQGDWTETKITPDLWQISYALPSAARAMHQKDPACPWVQSIIGTYLLTRTSESSMLMTTPLP